MDTYTPRPQPGPYADQFLGGRLVSGPTPNTLLPIVGQPVGPSLLTRTAGIGSNGDEVSQLQQFLNGRLDPSPGLLDNGFFDQKTLEAVIAFQRSSGLKPDGKVERKTWFKLLFGGRVAWPQKPQAGNTRAPTSSSIHPVAAWSVADKFDVVLTRTALQLPGDLRFTFQQVLDAGMRKSLSVILTTWAGALATNGSEAILFGLYCRGTGEVKLEALDVIEDFNSCLTAASNASKQTHLDHAATYLARVITRLGVTLFLTVIHKIVTRHDAKRDEARPALATSSGPTGKPIDMSAGRGTPTAHPAPTAVGSTAVAGKPLTKKAAALAKARDTATPFSEIC
jgi:peptidoglycan hydrolase-like protein with peptidoglycan-binding domain